MAKITDPDQLNVGTELTIDTSAKTFTLNVAGNLVAKDGCTIQALYSKFVELWTTATYNKFPFPMYAVDVRSGQYQFGTDGQTNNGWAPVSDATRQKLRDGGWSEYSAAGVLKRQYVGVVALASGYPAGAQFYYQRASGGPASNFTFTDAPNEGIQVYGDSSNGNFDTRTYFQIYCREPDYLYDSASLTDVGETATGAYKVQLPVAVGQDLKITDDDATVAANAPYTSIVVRFFAGAFAKDIDTVNTQRSFGIVIDAGTHSGVDGSVTNGGSALTTSAAGITGSNYTGGKLVIHEGAAKGTYDISGTPTSGSVSITGTFPGSGSSLSFTLYPAANLGATLPQIYTKIQYLLRQGSNINTATGSITGKVASALLKFVGDTLICGSESINPQGGGDGVVVEGIRPDDLNSIEFIDNSDATWTYPYASAGTLEFNAVLRGSPGYYRMYFTTLPGAGDDYGESSAVTVNDKDGVPIAGTIPGGGSVAFSFDYDGNVQGSRTAGQNAAVTIVAGRAGSAKPVVTTATITKSKGITISLVAEQDRAYLNA